MAGAVRRRRTLADVPDMSASEINKVIGEIRKRYGDGTIIKGSEAKQPYRIPTGIFTFDYATLGGIPHNRVTMFHGAKHSGKTTGACRCMAGAQSSMSDQQVAFIDVEGTYDATWGAKVGVDNEALLLVQPDSGEHAVDLCDGLLRARETSLIVIDSLAALLPLKEQESSAEDSLVGAQSRLITSMMRKISAGMIAERKRKHFVSILLINQQRTKIGGWSPSGEPLSLPGGKAVGFFSSLEVQWKNKEIAGKDVHGIDTMTHNEHAFSIQKNKMNGGMRTGEFQMVRDADANKFGLIEGEVDDAATLVAFSKKLGWYTGAGKGQRLEFLDFEQSFTSADACITFLYENPDIKWKLRTCLIADHARRMGMKEEFLDYLMAGVE